MGGSNAVAMRYSGGQIYRGEIPGQPSPSNVEYFVNAFDWSFNEGIGAPLSFLVGGIPGDIDGDGDVDTADLLTLLAEWGPCDRPCPPSCAADVDDDCNVGTSDLLLLLANWG